jgi:hypothetical protein
VTCPASTVDIELRWRPLSTTEALVASTRLGDAWRMLKRLVPDLESRLAAGTNTDLSDDVVQVLSDSVIRLLRLGDFAGIKRATVALDDASRSVEFSDEGAGGELYFTDAELESVSSPTETYRGRAYSVIPS